MLFDTLITIARSCDVKFNYTDGGGTLILILAECMHGTVRVVRVGSGRTGRTLVLGHVRIRRFYCLVFDGVGSVSCDVQLVHVVFVYMHLERCRVGF